MIVFTESVYKFAQSVHQIMELCITIKKCQIPSLQDRRTTASLCHLFNGLTDFPDVPVHALLHNHDTLSSATVSNTFLPALGLPDKVYVKINMYVSVGAIGYSGLNYFGLKSTPCVMS